MKTMVEFGSSIDQSFIGISPNNVFCRLLDIMVQI